MSEEMTKEWERPRLIILGRGRPEEQVLAVCKTKLSFGPSADDCGLGATQECQAFGNS